MLGLSLGLGLRPQNVGLGLDLEGCGLGLDRILVIVQPCTNPSGAANKLSGQN